MFLFKLSAAFSLWQTALGLLLNLQYWCVLILLATMKRKKVCGHSPALFQSKHVLKWVSVFLRGLSSNVKTSNRSGQGIQWWKGDNFRYILILPVKMLVLITSTLSVFRSGLTVLSCVKFFIIVIITFIIIVAIIIHCHVSYFFCDC